MKIILLILFCSFGFGQTLVMEGKYPFQKELNEYNINNILEEALNTNGFAVYYATDVLPDSEAINACEIYKINLKSDNSLFVTKLKFEVINCKNEIVFTSTEGKSKEKEYVVAYKECFEFLKPEIKRLKTVLSKLKVSVLKKPEITTEIIVKTDKNEVSEEKKTNNTNENELASTYKVEKYTATKYKTNSFVLQPENTNLYLLEIFTTSKSDVFLVRSKENNGVIVFNGNFYTWEYIDTNGNYQLRDLSIRFQ